MIRNSHILKIPIFVMFFCCDESSDTTFAVSLKLIIFIIDNENVVVQIIIKESASCVLKHRVFLL